ncbi:DUF1173 family protein [Caballeronia grimmiae]|uniref:DUF1173 family protein n=1 Tax=Caballeronia grimmiae TaxID=1071679 RepID=UPI001FCFDFB0|nr:DUF1173 family protein [Caballeronia grimmiae]
MVDNHRTIYNPSNQKTYSAGFQTETNTRASWQSVLKTAHVAGQRLQCLCRGARGDGERELEVRNLESIFFLAKKKLTGQEHDDECRFYAPDRSKSGLGAYAVGVVDDDSGEFTIRVGMGLKMADETPASSFHRQTETGVPGSKVPRVTLVGLLHLLWEKSRLNHCAPATVDLRGNVGFRLLKSAERVFVGKVRLSECLMVFSNTKASKAVLETSVKRQRRAFLVAPLSGWNSSRPEAEQFGLADFLPQIEFTLLGDVWRQALNRFPLAVSAWRNGHKVLAIAQFEPNRQTASSYRGEIVGIALMQITDHWISVESSYEREVANALVTASRSFQKPLKFDADLEEVFPDFVLRDAGGERGTPMEVFGRSDLDYAARKTVKEEYYNRVYGVSQWWKWEPLTGTEMPPFPAPDFETGD